MNQFSAYKDFVMALLDKLRSLGELILRVVTASDAKYAELVQINEQLKAKVADLETSAEAAEAVIAQIEQGLTVNPTPAADEIVTAADESSVPNTPAVDEAMESTVGTDQPTSETAVSEAIEMLTGDQGVDAPDSEAQPATGVDEIPVADAPVVDETVSEAGPDDQAGVIV